MSNHRIGSLARILPIAKFVHVNSMCSEENIIVDNVDALPVINVQSLKSTSKDTKISNKEFVQNALLQ